MGKGFCAGGHVPENLFLPIHRMTVGKPASLSNYGICFRPLRQFESDSTNRRRFFSTWIWQVVNHIGMVVGGGNPVSRLGADIRATRLAPLNMARAALRPPVASHPSRGAFAPPMHPTTRNPARLRRPLPTLRGLDGRQRRVPLHRQSGEPCSPDTLSVRLSRPTPQPAPCRAGSAAGARPLHPDP